MQDRRRGWLFAASGMLLLSTDSLFIRWSRAEAWDIAFLVALLSFPLYVVLNVRTERISPVAAVRAFPVPVLGVACLSAVSQISFITAVTRTSVSNVVVIVAAAPVLAVLVGRVFFGTRTSRRVWAAIALTFAGVTVIVTGSVGEPSFDGDLLALAAIAAFATNMNIWRRFPDMSRLITLSISSGIVIAITAFFASPFTLDGRAYLACAGMGLLFNPTGRLLNTHAPRYAPAAEVALFTPVETVAATVWAWLAFSEAPKTGTLIGGAIVIGGVLYGTFGQRRYVADVK